MNYSLKRTFAALSILVGFSLFASSKEEQPIVYYDMTPLFKLDFKNPVDLRRFYDETLLVVSLQGLVNREQPRLYIRYNAAPDDFWKERMTEPGGWLSGRTFVQIDQLDALLQHFAGYYQGAVVWDEAVPATSNAAATIAGCENLLSIRYDQNPRSVYQRFIESSLQIPVNKRLLHEDGSSMFTGRGTVPQTDVSSSGSAKCDVYLWMIDQYIKTGKVNPKLLGYYLDAFWLQCWRVSSPQNHTLTNLDFIIANRGVCFDLNVWDDEATVDDPAQKPGTDVRTLKKLLHAVYEQFNGDGMIHAAGFTPWAFKYTDYRSGDWSAGGKHGGVPTEWKYAEILSCFNAYMDADALGYSSMANASFFQHFPLPEAIPQNPKSNRESLKSQSLIDAGGLIAPYHYVAHYVGDYDSAAWLYWMLPRMWTDPNRGSLPLTWAFNPNLAVRFPLGMMWSRENRTANDFFSAGDSGAGYLNPALLSEPRSHSNLPSGVAAWERHCLKFFQQWDISLTGFVIDGNGPGLAEEGLDAYARFSPGGIIPQKIPPQGVHKGMPFLRMGGDLPGSAKDAARMIAGRLRQPAPQFTVFRSILKTPSWYAEVSRELDQITGDSVRLVDLYTLMQLVLEYEEHPELYDQLSSPYANAGLVRATPDKREGLQPVFVNDGPFSVEEQSGRACWRLPEHSPPYYLYFDVVDDFYHSGSGPLSIRITLWDQGVGDVRLQYDSTDRAAAFGGVYKDSPMIIRRSDGGAWRTVVIPIDDARFENGQNNGTDFRFYNSGESLLISEIVIERMKQ
ncbi:MAG: hypothetical protein JXR73_05875 [Candidatus Omnitrophica bacterium]|nr:hypothetical protein [Candidatus Omnitrophota bacterium]